jgi:hypothetical protein
MGNQYASKKFLTTGVNNHIMLFQNYKGGSSMRKNIIVLILLFLSLSISYADESGSDGSLGLILGANVGYEFLDGYLLFGGSVGYALTLGPSEFDVILDAYFSFGGWDYSYDDWQGEYAFNMQVLAIHLDWLILERPEEFGLFPVIGAGFFVFKLAYTEDEYFIYDPSITYNNSDDITAGGSIALFGLGIRMTKNIDLRINIPVMVFFSEFSQASDVAIPLTISGIYRL